MFSFNEYLFLAAAYLIGSIPFGVIVAKCAGIGDITKHGSGNVGATNLVRVGGRKLGALTFLLDFMKGFLPVTIYIVDNGIDVVALAGAILCVTGHILPVFNRFKGGKGVATGFGVVTAINPVVGVVMLGLWLILFMATRISSAAALFSFAMMPFVIFTVSKDPRLMVFGVVLSLIIYICHLENIKRLLNGTEKSFK